MSKLFHYFLLIALVFCGFQSKAQLTASDIQVSINYLNGTMKVTWKDNPGGTNVCRLFTQKEKISYRVGSSTTKIFDNTTGGSSGNNYADFNSLPGSFFTNDVTIIFEGEHGNALATCGTPLLPVNLSLPFNSKIDDPQALSSTLNGSCSYARLEWSAPTIVAGSALLRYEVSRRNAGSTGSFTNVNTNVSGSSIAYNDISAPGGVELEYKVKSKMLYSGRTAITNGATIKGQRIGIPGNASPTGVFIDQANCNGALDVNWNWSNSNNPNNFDVLKSTSSTFASGNTTVQLSGSDRSYRDNSALSGTRYYYKVRATASCPNSSTNLTSSYSSAANRVGLGVPNSTTVNSISTNTVNGTVTLNWTDNSGMEDGFKVVRQGPSGQVEFDVAENVTTYTDNSASACENLTYSVKVYNSCRATGVISSNSKTAYIPADIATVFDNVQNKADATDGEFGDRIEVKWKSSTRQVDDWSIYRINPLIPDTAFIASVDGRSRFYSDQSSNANTLYEYLIEGVSDCAGITIKSNTTKDVGFRLAFGTANGQITYDGGTAVEGVKVSAEAASGSSGNSGAFNGTSSYATAQNTVDLQTDSLTIVSFIRPTDLNGKQVIASKRTGTIGWEFFLQGSALTLTSGSKTISVIDTNNIVIAGNWFSVGASVTGDSVKLYINGSLAKAEASSQLSTNTATDFFIGKSGSTGFFNGQIDEMRLYNRHLSDQEIQRSFDVYINPSQVGLVGYWRFDEGFGSSAYDYSKTLLTPNKNHAALVNISFSSSKPSKTQLSAGAYTDKLGSYFIPFIPFLGNGDNYIITPSFGTHTFTPATTTLFIGGSTPNFNNVNFTDNSSFNVTGSVKFKNSTCFVKDIFILVDGEVVIKSDGLPVQTDEDGLFSLEVPIGPHVITTNKQGHVFSAGRFPTSGNYNFQQNEVLGSFIDSTLFKVVGRVAGGGIQKALPNGLNRGKNNIGSATINFVSQQGGGCINTFVSTNATTGEYEINLPPTKFEIPDFTVTNNNGIGFTLNTLIDLSLTPPLQTETDTLFKDSVGVKLIVRIDSSNYNTIRNFIHFEDPKLNVLSENFDNNYGSDSIRVKLGGVTTVIPTDTLGLQFPIFEENEQYTWQIQAYEVYENRDGTSPVFDSVPLTDGTFRINNSLASEPVQEFRITPQDNFSGTQVYRFVTGQANTARNATTPEYSFSRPFTLDLVTPTRNVPWKPNEFDNLPEYFFRGVIFGGRALGNSFATAGPQVVTMVLRDPPGSNSFSSWEKDVTRTSVSTFENAGGIGVNLGAEIKLGTKFAIGLGYTTEVEVAASVKRSTTIEASITSSNELVESVTRSIALNTSADPDFVGAGADIFFGRSLNMAFGLSQVVTLIDITDCGNGNSECFGNVLSYGGNDFKIGSTKTMFTVPGGSGTEFVFTQASIEESTIPKLEALRNQLLASNTYINVLPASNPNYGKSNDHPDFTGIGVGPTPEYQKNTSEDSSGVSYQFTGYRTVDTTITAVPFGLSSPQTRTITITLGTDSVWWYNQQIKLWEDAIARNEKEKVLSTASASNFEENLTVTAGATVSKTTSSSREESESLAINFSLKEELALSIGFEIAGNGATVEMGMNINYSHTTSTNTTQSTTTAFSYTMDDPDGGDEFTVDVFNSKDGYGPLFKTLGGQTACPYQGETRTKYYLPGTILDLATIQLEQPGITVSPSTLFNVPAQSAGVFTLNLVNNGLADQVYDLKVLESSNPNGARIKIDGAGPNRSFPVPAGTSISKQLEIEKGPNHIKYDSIALVFHSQCQYSFGTANASDIADTVYVSIQFLPSCTEVQISNPGDQFVLNNSFSDKLPLVLSGYDINYGGFEKVGLQYKPSAQSSWIPLSEEWFVDTTEIKTRYPNHTAPLLIPRNQSYITYDFDMAQLIDQNYQLRTVATCKIPGNPDKDEFSTVIGGIADRVNPHPFGTPSPADGVLGPNDDITIQFNEPIEAGSITIDNFQLSGVVNGQEVRHDKTVSFNGTTGYLQIANGFDFAYGSFTVEFWAKRDVLGTDQVVISQGNTPNNLFAVGFNATNNVEVTVGNQTYASTFTVLDDSTWHHYSIIYDKPNLNLDIVNRSSSTTVSSTNNNFFSSFTSGGKTFIGKNSQTNTEFFNGSAHQIRIWNRELSSSIIASRLNNNLTGREPGLVGYWPMEEGRGNLAEDKARSRNAEFYAQWEISPKSSSSSFDGVDDWAVLDSAGTLATSFEMDLTIEFWFKTAGGSAPMSFLSNGGGRFTPNGSNRNGWNIELATDNTIHVKNDSTDFTAVSANFADDNWHHFALVVNRATNATAYIDGAQQNTLSADNFYGFGAPQLAVGARYSVNGAIETFDQYFNGSLDEIRIWNSARLKDNIELDMYNRLKGDEFGLIAYYPFESYIVDGFGVPSLTPNFKDGSLSLLDLVPMNGAFVTSAQTPAIALQRPVKNINFTWSINNDKIVINTNEDPSNIENVTLNISVRNIKDLHGNKMQSPKTWIAYINKNQIKWQDVEKNLNKEFNDTLTFSTRVVNSGGEVKRFNIDNIPSWLTVSPSNGTITPQSTQAIRFTVNPALNIGDYTEDLLLSTDFGFDEKLSVKLQVKKTAPNFTFDNSLYAKSMNIIGQISVNGSISVNDEDILIAYINNEIRGKTNLQYIPSLDQYIGFLDVYSNNADSINFKVWNASEGELHENVTPNLLFIENSLTGSILTPQVFNAVNNLAKPIVLNAGWNWVSFPLTDNKMVSLHSFFEGLNFSSGDIVKTIGNNAFAQFGGPSLGWSGGLTRNGLNNDQSYLIYITNKDTLEYKGLAIDPDTLPISVAQGWNRIGFVSTKNIEINSALANYNATDGDLIKSQQAFAVYLSSLGWIGSLTTLEPTEGYLLKAASTSTFVYPRRGLLRLKANAEQEQLSAILPSNLTLNPNDFETSTSAIIKINTCEEVMEDSTWSLVAFKENDIRGYSKAAIHVNEEIGSEYFITVYGQGNESFRFEMLNSVTKEKLKVIGSISFEKDKLQGEVNEPILFDLIQHIDCDQFKKIEDAATTEDIAGAAYPNPFSSFLTIVIPQEISENGTIEIFDQNGRLVFGRNAGAERRIFLNGAELFRFTNGVYQLKFTDGKTIVTEKLVRLN
jgi:hypothetical protein